MTTINKVEVNKEYLNILEQRADNNNLQIKLAIILAVSCVAIVLIICVAVIYYKILGG